MTAVWVIGAALIAAIGSFGYVSWRDRERRSTGEERAAGRVSMERTHRYEAERHAQQGHTRDNGQFHGQS